MIENNKIRPYDTSQTTLLGKSKMENLEISQENVEQADANSFELHEKTDDIFSSNQ